MTAASAPVRAILKTALAFAIIGAVQGVVIAALYHAGWPWALRTSARLAAAALVWVPVTVLVARRWTSRASGRRTAVELALILLVVLAVEPLWLTWLAPFGASAASYGSRLIGHADTNVVFFLAIAGVSWLAAARRAEMRMALASARLESARVGLELQVLTSQLHPHFLFNTLNLISQLSYESQARALATLDNLRRLLQESIGRAGSPEIPLRDELRFLHAYVDIQQSRFGEGLRVSVDSAAEADECAVPHLLLQPLVENAIVHGLASRPALGSVRVTISRAVGRLLVSVDDDGVGMPAHPTEGVGLTNTRRRLTRIYGDDYRLRWRRPADGGTSLTLDLPVRAVAQSGDIPDEPAPVTEGVGRGSVILASVLRVPIAARIVAGWTAVALIWTELGAAASMAGGMSFERWTSLGANLLSAAIWMLLTPVVLAVTRRSRTVADSVRRIELTAAGAAIVATHLGAWLAILHAWHLPQYQRALDTVVGWLLWDALAFTSLATFTHLSALASRFEDARVGLERGRAALARERLAAMRLRLQPAMLMAGLDALHRAVAQDAARAETVIARMGDLLRLLLESADRESLAVAQEMALLQAYTDVLSRHPDPELWPFEPIDAAVPATAFAGLAATIVGSIDAVRLRGDAGVIELEIGTVDGTIAGARVEELRRRLGGIFTDKAAVSIRHARGWTYAALRIPRQPTPADAGEDAVVFALAGR